ncbi:GrpE, mitochondrial [Thecaphora frezii]
MFSSASRSIQRVASQVARNNANLVRSQLVAAPASFRMAFSSSSRWSNANTEKLKEEQNAASGEAMGASDKATGGAEVEALQAQIQEKDAKIKELTEQILYGKADYQNLQRRSKEEKSQAGDYAITKLAKDLTSTIDILSLALKSVPEELRTAPQELDPKDPRRVVADLYSGVELTSKSMLDMLRTHGITQFDPTGEKFDPKEHEALYQAPIPGKESGTVLECSKIGYRIKDRLLRAAEVGVVQ